MNLLCQKARPMRKNIDRQSGTGIQRRAAVRGCCWRGRQQRQQRKVLPTLSSGALPRFPPSAKSLMGCLPLLVSPSTIPTHPAGVGAPAYNTHAPCRCWRPRQQHPTPKPSFTTQHHTPKPATMNLLCQKARPIYKNIDRQSGTGTQRRAAVRKCCWRGRQQRQQRTALPTLSSGALPRCPPIAKPSTGCLPVSVSPSKISTHPAGFGAPAYNTRAPCRCWCPRLQHPRTLPLLASPPTTPRTKSSFTTQHHTPKPATMNLISQKARPIYKNIDRPSGTGTQRRAAVRGCCWRGRQQRQQRTAQPDSARALPRCPPIAKPSTGCLPVSVSPSKIPTHPAVVGAPAYNTHAPCRCWRPHQQHPAPKPSFTTQHPATRQNQQP